MRKLFYFLFAIVLHADTPKSVELMTWEEAQRHCRDQHLELPSKQAIIALTLEPKTYWTNTELDDDIAYAWAFDAKAFATIEISKEEHLAVNCTHDKPKSKPLKISQVGSNLHDWLEANRYCNNLKEGKNIRWRLPDIEELFALSTIKQRHKLLPEIYWSRTLKEQSSEAMIVSFYYDGIDVDDLDESNHVVCVGEATKPLKRKSKK